MQTTANKAQIFPEGNAKVIPMPFKKSEKEKSKLKLLKKEFNKKLQSALGTKRPTAGIVKRIEL